MKLPHNYYPRHWGYVPAAEVHARSPASEPAGIYSSIAGTPASQPQIVPRFSAAHGLERWIPHNSSELPPWGTQVSSSHPLDAASTPGRTRTDRSASAAVPRRRDRQARRRGTMLLLAAHRRYALGALGCAHRVCAGAAGDIPRRARLPDRGIACESLAQLGHCTSFLTSQGGSS